MFDMSIKFTKKPAGDRILSSRRTSGDDLKKARTTWPLNVNYLVLHIGRME